MTTVEHYVELAEANGFVVREIRKVNGIWEAWVHQDIGEETTYSFLVRRVQVPYVRLRGNTPTEAAKAAVEFMLENPDYAPWHEKRPEIKTADQLLEDF